MNKSIGVIEKNFKLDLGSIKNIYPIPVGQICSKLGIKVIFDDLMPNDWFGSIAKTTESCVISVNARHSALVNIFTIAHELGHYVRHQDRLNLVGQFVDKRIYEYTKREMQHEKQANDFAEDLLMPAEKFCEIYTKNEGCIAALADFFMVTHEGVFYRGVRLGLMFGMYA